MNENKPVFRYKDDLIDNPDWEEDNYHACFGGDEGELDG